jgi:hypothetical protein
MADARWISEGTRAQAHARALKPTHARTQKYEILIAFPQEKWLRERASMLRYTYIACLVEC